MTMNESANAVELHGVVKKFGDVTAVNCIDLTIADGEFFSLLGPSGCGKTTILRMIAGFEFPTAGHLAVDGQKMGLTPPDQRPVNTVFQNYALFPHMTVLENVMFGLLMKKVPKDKAREAAKKVLDQVHLGALGERKSSQLSGGQQQRVALARALVNKPKVLLLDEPLGALDLKLRQEMQSELKSLHTEVGITFVYVTHDQEEALTMSDRIGVMSEGNLLQVDTPDRIYEHPTKRFVADFIGEINMLAATVADDGTVQLGSEQIKLDGLSPEVGQSFTLAIRPESIDLTGPDQGVEPGLNQISGTVTHRTYFGDAYSYDVETGGGVLSVRCDNRPDHQRFNEGDAVKVSWRPDSSSVLKD